MKPIVGLAVIFGLALGIGFAADAPVQKDASSAKAPPAPAAKKDKEELAKIDGITIPRKDGTFLGLEVKENNFVLKFYDKDKKKAKPDVSRAAARWAVKYQPTDERVVLNASGDVLTSPFVIRPPHQFKVTLTLLSDLPDKPAESYNVDYHD